MEGIEAQVFQMAFPMTRFRETPCAGRRGGGESVKGCGEAHSLRTYPISPAVMSQPPTRKRNKISRLFSRNSSQTAPAVSAEKWLAPSTTSVPVPSPSPAVRAFSVCQRAIV
jgi:hypothetical protein